MFNQLPTGEEEVCGGGCEMAGAPEGKLSTGREAQPAEEAPLAFPSLAFVFRFRATLGAVGLQIT